MTFNKFALGKKTRATFLILLILSSGLLLPVSGADQQNEFSSRLDVSQLNGFFSAVIQNEKSNYGNPDQGSSGSGHNPFFFFLTVPSNPSQKEDILYFRQGDTFIVYPLSFQENRNSPAMPFATLLLIWVDSERRRSRFQIYVEILELLKKRAMTPFEISFCLRLNSKRTREYVEFLAAKGFLEFSINEGKQVCVVTPSGKIFLNNLKMIFDEDSENGEM